MDGHDRLLLEIRPVILKIHGAVDRQVPGRDSYVITEDDFIDYLTMPELTTLLPIPLPERLNRCHFLFLGFSLTEWTARAFLRRIWRNSPPTWNSWAIQFNVSLPEARIWSRRHVEYINMNPEDYVTELDRRLRGIVDDGDAASVIGP